MAAGGASRVAKRTCHLCLVLSSELTHFNLDEERCIQFKEDNICKCVCHEVTDNKYAEKINDYLLGFVRKNKNENSTYEEFVENHKQLRIEKNLSLIATFFLVTQKCSM